jgi:sugar/nucleoside kinase (ribokinase family)
LNAAKELFFTFFAEKSIFSRLEKKNCYFPLGGATTMKQDAVNTLVSFHVVGDAFVDLLCYTDEDGSIPEIGGDVRLVRPIQSMAGGSATNTATHLQSFPLDSTIHLHTVINPNDEYGKLMLNHATRHGYQFWNCVPSGQDPSANMSSTGHCVVIVTKGGDRSFLTHSGCVQAFQASHVDYSKMSQDSASHIHVHLAGYYNMEGFWDGKLMRELQHLKEERNRTTPESSVVISLVPQYDASCLWEGGLRDVMTLLDFFIMNETEAQYITKGKTKDDWTKYFSKLNKNTWIIITLGKDGAVAVRDGKIEVTQAAVEVTPVDTTGAGDAFVSGFLYAIWEWRKMNNSFGMDTWPVACIQSGLLWGCSVATCSVLNRGASVPSLLSDIHSFVDRTKNL